MTTKKSYPIASFKALEDEGPGRFQAVVSVFDNVDLQGDRVKMGAFKGTIAKWRRKGDPIPVIWSHDWLNPEAFIGEVDPADAAEIAKGDSGPGGLLVKGTIDVHKPFAAQVFDLLKSRRVKEWSFAYDVLDEKTAKDGANELLELDLLEVGPTLKGANSETYTVSAKSAMEAELKEAFEADRSLGKFIDMIKTVEDPTVARMLTKTMMQGTTKKDAHRFHLEPSGEKFACVSNQTGLAVDLHEDEADAKTHIERLEKGDYDSAKDDAIRKALGLELLVIESKATEEATPEPEADADAKAIETPEDEGAGGESKPWRTEKQGDEYCCIATDSGETVDCHETAEQSEAHIRALYANAPEGEADASKSDDEAKPDDEAKTITTYDGEGKPKNEYVASDGYADAKAVQEATGVATSTAITYTTSTNTNGDTSWTISVPAEKAGRVIGAKAAATLKARVADAIDGFIAEVNGEATETASAPEAEKEVKADDEPETKAVEQESPSQWLERLLEGQE